MLSLRSLESGAEILRHVIDSPAVGAIIDSGGLVWWDRQGRSYRMDLGGGRPALLVDLGESLERASPGDGGWVVTSSGGEVAWVELAQSAHAVAREGE
jgi:hypothetical protein